jgi:hypothetical protein
MNKRPRMSSIIIPDMTGYKTRLFSLERMANVCLNRCQPREIF